MVFLLSHRFCVQKDLFGVTAVSRFWEVPQTHVIIGVRGVFLFGVTGVTVA